MRDLFPTLGPTFKRTLTEFFPAFGRALRCLGRGIKKLARPVLYLLLALVVIHIIATLVTGHLVKKKLSEIKAAGGALTTKELAPSVPPGEQNAADLYQQAFESLRLSDDDNETLFPEPDISDADRLALAREVVSANSDYFALLDEASRIPDCAFPVDWDAGFEMTFPHLAKMRQAARMLALRAEVLAAGGDFDAAIASCAAALRMAEHAKLEPTLIGQLVAYAIQKITVSTLEHALSEGAPSPRAARQLFDQLAAINQLTPFARTMQGERTFGLHFFRFVRSAPVRDVARLAQAGMPIEPAGSWHVAAVALYRTVGRPILNVDELTYLRLWEKFDRAVQLPWPDSREEAEALEQTVGQLPTYRSFLTRMVFPVFTRSVWVREETTAKLGASQVALALKAYRGDHDRYPDSLADLEAVGWELPTDAFGAGPYHYRRDGDGFIVWSLGQDMDDDGGRPFDQAAFDARTWSTGEERDEAQRDYDLPFHCQR